MFRCSICATLLSHVFGARVMVQEVLEAEQRDVPSEADVVIIGAGYAGLTAARDLVAAGLQVAVFEGSDRAGGRTRNHDVPGVSRDRGGNLETVEVGGQWLGFRENHPNAWQLIVDELGFELFETPSGSSNQDGGDTVASTSRGTSSDLLDVVGFGNAAEMLWAVLAATREKWLLQLPWTGWLRNRLNAMTFEDWLASKGVGGIGVEMVKTTLLGCGEHPSRIGALGPVYGLGGGAALGPGGTNLENRVKGGLAAPVLAMAEELASSVHFNSQAVSIAQDEDKARVTIQQNGAEFEVRAQHVLFSGSPYTTLNITFTPPLPQEKRELLEKLQNGQTVKATLVYDRPFWKDRNLSGSIVNAMNLDDNFTSCLDNTPPDSNLGYMVCFAQDNFGRNFVLLTEEERRDRMANFLASHYNDNTALQPLWYTDFDWSSQPLIQGGCMGFWPPSTDATALTEDFGRVSWIGADLEVDYVERGYVEGAIRTARQAARRLISELVAEQ